MTEEDLPINLLWGRNGINVMDFVVKNQDRLSYEVEVFVRANVHYYSDGKQNSVKYSCPVCDMVGFRHQVFDYSNKNCPNCGVKLAWGDDKNED